MLSLSSSNVVGGRGRHSNLLTPNCGIVNRLSGDKAFHRTCMGTAPFVLEPDGATLACRPAMARIRTSKTSFSLRVVVTGTLAASDMRRLEHACASALTAQRAELVIDLTRVTGVDNVAAAHLRYIAQRGAVLETADDRRP